MGIIRKVFILAVALGCCQFPAFEGHYESLLGVRVDELKRQVHLYETAAKATGHSLESYIDFFDKMSLPEASENARIMNLLHKRYLRLKIAYERIYRATEPYKYIEWVRGIDFSLLSDSLKSYEIRVEVSRSSLTAALIGATLAWLLSALLRWLFWRKRQEGQKLKKEDVKTV